MALTPRFFGGGAQVRVPIAEASAVGECRREARRIAESCSFDEARTGQVSIIATELANNLVRHAGSGEMLIQAIDDGSRTEVELLSIDRGPGMADVGRCLGDGYSTAGTAGNGLGAVTRLSSTFDIYSAAGRGTVVLSRVSRQHAARGSAASAEAPLDFGAICIGLAGESECGDTWRIAHGGSTLALLVADGLGHGPLAATASRAAALAFVERPFDAPAEAMQRMHRALAGTRGAAVACAVLDAARASIRFCGIGNIAATVGMADRSRGMASHNGMVGVRISRTQEFEYEWPADSRVIMHSDGVSARWSLAAHGGLVARHPAVIAAVLYRDHARPRDDATMIVISRRPSPWRSS